MLYKNVVLHVSELRGNIVITVKHAFCVWIEDGIRVENVPVSTCSVTNRHDIAVMMSKILSKYTAYQILLEVSQIPTHI
jgi:hypothetical protein